MVDIEIAYVSFGQSTQVIIRFEPSFSVEIQEKGSMVHRDPRFVEYKFLR
jgi:hypothetical protein